MIFLRRSKSRKRKSRKNNSEGVLRQKPKREQAYAFPTAYAVRLGTKSHKTDSLHNFKKTMQYRLTQATAFVEKQRSSNETQLRSSESLRPTRIAFSSIKSPTRLNVCEQRRAKRRAIMRITRGRGLSVKQAIYTPTSSIICRG